MDTREESRTQLNDRLWTLIKTTSDINEHLQYLYNTAKKYKHITEFGVRHGVSTTALIAGRMNDETPGIGTVVSYDIHRHSEVDLLLSLAPEVFEFYQANTLENTIQETDVLFIDTLHNYDQLKFELFNNAGSVRHRIIMHDTTTFGTDGETGGRGLNDAIQEFLDQWPAWQVEAVFENNNGLTVLKRIR